MKLKFFIISLFSLILVGTYWYQLTAYICPAPLEYRLGALDDEFGITATTAISYIEEAETYWEEATGRDLFVYDDDARFTIDFVFDERQEGAIEQQRSRTLLDEKWVESESVREAIAGLQSSYDDLTSSHEADIADYESRLNSYNQEVTKYNDQGGAPSEIFAELEAEREELNQVSNELNVTANQLNKLASEINNLGERGNRLVEEYNREVNTYNQRFGQAGEFTQGDYQGDSVNIYRFSTKNEVVTVLAHEFGHALGMGHVEEKDALMYYLLEDPNSLPELTDADLHLFYEVCGQTDTLAHQVRRIIRNLLTIF